MAKKIMIALIIIAVAIAAVFLASYKTETFTYEVNTNCTESAGNRTLPDTSKLKEWWPGKIGKSSLKFEGADFSISKPSQGVLSLTCVHKTDSLKGLLTFIASDATPSRLVWSGSFNYSYNPLKKLRQFLVLKKMSAKLSRLLGSASVFFNDEAKVYGMKISTEKVTDTSLIVTKQSYDHEPTVQDIYGQIALIDSYIIKRAVKQQNYPMININHIGVNQYSLMVAIPVEKDIASNEKFALKKMVMGNILMGEVKGGVGRVRIAENELRNYVSDYKKTSPAMPFQSLVTNRLAEPDSSKWVTRVYYPVY